jgi:hypothetical protein
LGSHGIILASDGLCRNIQFKVKFGVDEEARDVKATYLDTAGRPVVIVRKHNLVDEHMVDCEVQHVAPMMASFVFCLFPLFVVCR